MNFVSLLSLSFFAISVGMAQERADKDTEEAVRELKLLKNNPELVKQPGGAGMVLPQPVAPDAPAMTLAPRAVLGSEMLEKAQKEAKKEQNWLIEGYWRQVREHTREGSSKGQGGTEWMKSTLGAELWLPKGGRNLQVSGDSLLDLEESRKAELPVSEAQKVADPFQPFLATWLSSRDFQILQKAGQAGVGQKLETGLPQDSVQPTKPSELVAENPYLKALNDGVLAGSSSVSMPVQVPGEVGPGAVPPAAGAAEMPPLMTPVSEPEKTVNPLSQKEEDRKFYPQLKRF
jgi:hypothetical protein